jgi:hypothetical protein
MIKLWQVRGFVRFYYFGMSIQRGLGHWKIAPIKQIDLPAGGSAGTNEERGIKPIRQVPIFNEAFANCCFWGRQADKQKTVTY